MVRILSIICAFALLMSASIVHGQTAHSEMKDVSHHAMVDLNVQSVKKDCCAKQHHVGFRSGENCTISCLAIADFEELRFAVAVYRPALIFSAALIETPQRRLKRPPRTVL